MSYQHILIFEILTIIRDEEKNLVPPWSPEKSVGKVLLQQICRNIISDIEYGIKNNASSEDEVIFHNGLKVRNNNFPAGFFPYLTQRHQTRFKIDCGDKVSHKGKPLWLITS
jgi:hypothetical protein